EGALFLILPLTSRIVWVSGLVSRADDGVDLIRGRPGTIKRYGLNPVEHAVLPRVGIAGQRGAGAPGRFRRRTVEQRLIDVGQPGLQGIEPAVEQLQILPLEFEPVLELAGPLPVGGGI